MGRVGVGVMRAECIHPVENRSRRPTRRRGCPDQVRAKRVLEVLLDPPIPNPAMPGRAGSDSHRTSAIPQRARYQRLFSHAAPDPEASPGEDISCDYGNMSSVLHFSVYELTGATSLAVISLHSRLHAGLNRRGEARRARGGRSWNGAPRGAAVTPPAFRPCAVRRNKWLRTRRGSSATATFLCQESSSGERCSKNDLRRPASGLRRVRRRRVRSRL